jgi:hypothetical protein
MENPALRENPVKEELFDFINQAEIPFINKDKIYRTVTAELPVSSKLAALQSMKLDADLLGVLTEILTADGK